MRLLLELMERLQSSTIKIRTKVDGVLGGQITQLIARQ